MPKTRRPKSVTILALGVLTLAGINLVRLAQSLVQWEFLGELLPFSPLYLALTGAIWGITGLLLTWGLWRGRSWAPQLARGWVVAYSLYYWLDRLWLGNPSGLQANLPFMAVLTFLILGYVFWQLSRYKTKVFFGVLNDR